MDLSKINSRNPGVKRILKEAIELSIPNEEIHAMPIEDNLFEWHFTIRGAPDTEFENGYYHGRILLPHQYPMKPPNIILLTPNGRFEVNKKICLTISDYHPENWQPSWSIRTALLALIAFMPTESPGSIGSIHFSKEERRALALKSQQWHCPICGCIADKLRSKKTELHSRPTDNNMVQQKDINIERTTRTRSYFKISFVITWAIVVFLLVLLIRKVLQ